MNELPKMIAKNPDRSKYSPELFEFICTQMEKGTSLRKVCDELEISHCNVIYWAGQSDELADRYSRAQERMADIRFNLLLERAASLHDRDEWVKWIKENDLDAKAISAIIGAVDKGIGRELDLLKRLNPQKYGDKQQLDHNINETVTIVEQLRAARERCDRLRSLPEEGLLEYNSADSNTIDVTRVELPEREGDKDSCQR